ncbi:hypothetical protein QF030_000475 [Streptomyces rishiriensis]|uniref:Uncharacterized protein n=1 Tax=Streptomyces rishiriensis TaxID=68264 RepID=A0ABU0NGQ9_STRRH|nr:hypothetical protein [Streptomyces rishiriensis]
MFNGAWKSEDPFTGFDRMSKSGMKRCENKIAKQLRGNNPALNSGQLNYAGSSVIPESIRMAACTKEGQLFDVTVKNVQDWQTIC